MVVRQIVGRGIKDGRVIAAMTRVPREDFAPPLLHSLAYSDTPLPIGSGQTLSQPYIVAFMLEALHLTPTDRVLEIGTGSGYNTVLLSHLAYEVYSIENIGLLYQTARARVVKHNGTRSVHLKHGNGYLGWPEAAPFDAIILTAAPTAVPQVLFEQLTEGGRLIAPEGDHRQTLNLYERQAGVFRKTALLPVQFVPMVRPGTSGQFDPPI